MRREKSPTNLRGRKQCLWLHLRMRRIWRDLVYYRRRLAVQDQCGLCAISRCLGVLVGFHLVSLFTIADCHLPRLCSGLGPRLLRRLLQGWRGSCPRSSHRARSCGASVFDVPWPARNITLHECPVVASSLNRRPFFVRSWFSGVEVMGGRWHNQSRRPQTSSGLPLSPRAPRLGPDQHALRCCRSQPQFENSQVLSQADLRTVSLSSIRTGV